MLTITPPMNPQSTTLKASMLTITPPMNSQSTTLKASMLTITPPMNPQSGQSKDYKIGICCFSAKHAASRRKNKDWLARNQDNVSEWSDIFIRTVVSVS
jgi:hypothetical protein